LFQLFPSDEQIEKYANTPGIVFKTYRDE